jgi:hypothetical protein
MCPFCFTTIGLVVAGMVATGGVAALTAKVFRTKNNVGEIIPNSNERSNPDVNTRTQ